MQGRGSEPGGATAPQSVRDYYEANTRGFLRWGQGGEAGVLHRAVWGPGVHSRVEAFGWAHRRVQRASPCARPRVLDLGCGVGAGLLAVVGATRGTGVGVTLSPTQVEIARRRAASAGLAEDVRFVEADFCRLPELGEPFDLAFSIEAFVHAEDPDAWFAGVEQRLRPGGRLVIIDDVRSARAASDVERGWLEAFERGWRAPNLATRAHIEAMALARGLRPIVDERWSAWLELRRPRDRWIAGVLRVPGLEVVARRLGGRAHAAWGNLRGGDALQRLLLAGVVEYRCMIFEAAGGSRE